MLKSNQIKSNQIKSNQIKFNKSTVLALGMFFGLGSFATDAQAYCAGKIDSDCQYQKKLFGIYKTARYDSSYYIFNDTVSNCKLLNNTTSKTEFIVDIPITVPKALNVTKDRNIIEILTKLVPNPSLPLKDQPDVITVGATYKYGKVKYSECDAFNTMCKCKFVKP
jgi:hypothetical protein